MNNLTGPLVHYYDVGNFHATIFKSTRALHVSATTCMVQPTTIHNGIGCTLIGQQGSLAGTKNIATVSGIMVYVSTTYKYIFSSFPLGHFIGL